MKKNAKRQIILAILLAMICTILPVGALAEADVTFVPEDIAEVSTEESISVVHVNPLYADVISAEDLVFPTTSGSSLMSELTYHADIASAAAEIRPAMEAREAEFSVGYLIPADQYHNLSRVDIGYEIMDKAFSHTGVPTQGDYLLWQYGGYRMGISSRLVHDENGSNYNVKFTFTMSYYTDAAQEAAVTAAVDTLLASVINDSMTDYEKLTALYEWMCQNITYDYDNMYNPNYFLQYTAYGALINRTSVCQGYANLLYRLALEIGIDSRLITGIGNGGGHAWNILKMGNSYYNADATWDASYRTAGWGYQYYLTCEANFTEGYTDHFRDAEYDTTAFHALYPMSPTDYDPTEEPAPDPEPEPEPEPEPAVPSGDWGNNLHWILAANGTLTISGQGGMDGAEDYSDELNAWAFPWTYHRDQVTAIVIEEGVTSVAEGAFSDFPAESVSLPEGLVKIGTGAFARSAIKTLELPDSVTTIGMSSFYECSALTSVKLPAGLTFAGEGVFAYCTSLETVVMPEMPNFGTQDHYYFYAMFECCSSLTDITFHTNGVIGSYMYSACTALRDVTIPSSVTKIYDRAFYYCTNLRSVTIPDSVLELEAGIFEESFNLTNIYFEGCPPTFNAEEAYGRKPLDTVTATAWYPAGNPGWTEEVMESYGGYITWVPYDRLDRILSNTSMSAAEQIEAIQIMDNAELQYCMAQNDQIFRRFADLESQANIAGAISKAPGFNGFNVMQVSVVGVKMNPRIDETQGVILTIGNPAQTHVLEDVYNNSKDIQFSMTLENVVSVKDLEVPVQVTLPVPATINPELLVVLHYQENGTAEEVTYNLIQDEGQFYAQFVLTGFSDFVMTQYATEDDVIVGDLNGDGIVTDDDVALLLWYTLFPEDFEIQGYADFTDDGIVTDDDVAYLLWHTLFPEDFPLGRWTDAHM